MLVHERCGKEITTDPEKLSPGYQSACEWCDEDLYNFEVETITPPVEAIAKHLGYGKKDRDLRPVIAGRSFEDAQALAIAKLSVEALKQNGFTITA